MSIRNKITLSAVSLSALVALAPTHAAQLTPGRKAIAPPPVEAVAAPVELAAGVTVRDTADGEVGTVISVEGDFVIVKTDKYEVRLPKTSFTTTPEGAIIALTRAQLNAGVEQAMAQAGPVLSTGATVRDVAGEVVGTVEEFDEEFATVALAGEEKVRLPVDAFARGQQGPVIGMTVAELQAAAAGAGASAQ
jgi:hypothetical protein